MLLRRLGARQYTDELIHHPKRLSHTFYLRLYINSMTRLYISSTVTAIFTILLYSCSSITKSPYPSAVVENSTRLISIKAKRVAIDKLNSIYVLGIDNRLRKYDQNGNFKFDYVNNSIGNIDVLDVTNPLGIMVYYKNFGTIKILDNTLSEIKTIQINKSGRYFGAFPVCMSNDNNFWIFDPQEGKIFKISEELNVIVETNHFNDLGFKDPRFSRMVERGNILVATDDRYGLFMFDNFGQFIRNIPVKGVLDFYFDGNQLIYRTKEGFFLYNIQNLTEQPISLTFPLKNEDIIYMSKSAQSWIIAFEDGVDLYKI